MADSDQLQGFDEPDEFDDSSGSTGHRGGGHGTAVAERHESAPVRLVGFLRGSWRELQRVQWPDRRQVMQATGVVLGFVIVAGVFLGISDLAFSKLMNLVLK